jgi:hypothetical protein
MNETKKILTLLLLRNTKYIQHFLPDMRYLFRPTNDPALS